MILPKLLNTKLFFIAAMAFVLFAGCQKEYLEVSEPDNDATITATDSVAGLVLKIALKDGSFDNIIDRCSEISINFPYSVRIKNEVLEVSSSEDVQNIKLEYFDLRNEFNLEYPVTVTFSDYTETVLSNKGELRQIQNQHNTTVYDDDIECIDFIYPFEASVYNTQYQKYDQIEIEDDMELYDVFNKINDLVIELKYPIEVKNLGGIITTINNNKELEKKIREEVKAGCDEEDETEFTDEDYPYSDLIINNEWEIFFYADTIDQSNLFNFYLLDFKNDNTVQAIKGAEVINGTWELIIGQNLTTFKIEFNTDVMPISWLNQNWEIVKTNPVFIEMQAESVSGEYVSELKLKKLNKN